MKWKLMAAAALLVPWTAQAADLGGNCCADLEERIAELEQTVARKGNRKMSLEVSGHVNQALFTTDIDAIGLDRVRIIDNDNSSSRFRFRGSADAGGGWSAGFLMELGVGSDIATRHAAVYLKLKNFGAVWLGQTSEATNGIMELSLAPHDASTLTTLAPFATVVEDETGLGLPNPFDGSRTETITFRSAEVAGFSGALSWNGSEDYSMALRHASEFGPMRLAAGVGYRKEDVFAFEDVVPGGVKLGERKFWGGSASLMHVPSGLFIDGAYGNSDGWQTFTFDGIGNIPIGDGKLQIYAGRGGLSRKFTAMGKTTVYGEYGQLKIEGEDIDPKFFGLGLSQDLEGAATTIYMGWRRYDLDIDEDDINTFVGGVKVRF